MNDDDKTQANPVIDVVTSTEVRLLRNDFQMFTKRMEAMLRIITDPVSGYMPRSEVEHRLSALTANVKWAIGFTLAIASLIATFVRK